MRSRAPHSRPASGAPPCRRVLVAEDDPEQRSALVAILAGEGFEVVEAATGDESLEQLADDGFDLLITDIAMPGPPGVNVVAIARTAGAHAPVLVITALDEVWVESAVARLSSAALLRKPFSRDALIACVRALLAAAAADDDDERERGRAHDDDADGEEGRLGAHPP